MEALRREISANFGQGLKPSANVIVRWDGFDENEKSSAVQFYTGKTWSDVLAHLCGLDSEPVFRAAYYLEEWSVLSEEALPYYLRAYLEFLVQMLSSPQPDEEFVYFFLGALYQVIYMHKRSPFNPTQTSILQQVARYVAASANDERRFVYFHENIKDHVKMFLAELRSYDS